MKSPLKNKKESKQPQDDTLFGLLSMYKAFNTYFRIIIANENDILALQITKNPKYWPSLDEGKYKGFKTLKRPEIGTIKLSVKYIAPEHLIDQLGLSLGLKIPAEEVVINNKIEYEGYLSIETKNIYLQDIGITINKIIELSPQKKLELLEKCLSQET